LFVATAVALLLGYLWACVDGGRNPLDPVRLIWGRPPEVVQRPSADPPKPKPPLLSPEEMSIRFSSIDESLALGRIPEAQEKVRAIDRLLVPEPSMDRLRGYERRVDRYGALLLETSRGGLIERPRLWALAVEGGAVQFVRGLTRENGRVCFETLRGRRSSVKESDVRSQEPLEETSARAEVRGELVRLAAAAGIEVWGDPGGPASCREAAGRSAGGLAFFDLADFCARNGANEEIVPLFDEGLRRDPDLVRTVREARAGRLVDVFRYFRVIRASDDARRTLEILKDRYADTEAFKRIDDQDPVLVVDEVEKPSPGKAGELTALGDRLVDEARAVLRRSDPQGDPAAWAAASDRAIELLMKAISEGYLPAQETYSKGGIPKPLLDRVRETQKLIYELRRMHPRK
jgi:hypothetical protein